MAETAIAGDGLRLVFWIETDIGEGLSDPVYIPLPDKILSIEALGAVERDFSLAFISAYQDAVNK